MTGRPSHPTAVETTALAIANASKILRRVPPLPAGDKSTPSRWTVPRSFTRTRCSAVGHSSVSVTERHYAHLLRGDVVDLARQVMSAPDKRGTENGPRASAGRDESRRIFKLRAACLGRRGRRFESSRPDHFSDLSVTYRSPVSDTSGESAARSRGRSRPTPPRSAPRFATARHG